MTQNDIETMRFANTDGKTKIIQKCQKRILKSPKFIVILLQKSSQFSF